jgi:hypothetical protein
MLRVLCNNIATNRFFILKPEEVPKCTGEVVHSLSITGSMCGEFKFFCT